MNTTATVTDFIRALPVGRGNALTARALAERLGTDDRALRALAADAVEAGALVVADNGGYYIPASADEADEAIRRLESQGRKMLRRAAQTRSLVYRLFHPEQGQLF